MSGDVQVRFCERRGAKLPPATLLERGLAILGAFTPERPVLGIADIADDLGVSRSTTHRYVITLVALGFLEQGASRKYRLGLRVTDLGMSALNSTGLREHSRPYLEELRQRTSYTVNLAVLDGPEILYIDRARSFRRRPNSITSKKALRTELEHVLGEGMAVNDEELAQGLHSISVPVRTESGEVVAAVNIAAHSSMISLELVDALGPHLIATADNISARLGYRREDEQGRRT